MAKEQAQTEEVTEVEETTREEEAEQQQADSAAVKTSEQFDKMLDEEGVEVTPPEDDSDVNTETDDKDKADEKDTGKEEESSEEETRSDGDEGKISEELTKRAIDLGITAEEIAAFENDAELEKTVKIIEAVIAEDDEEAPQPRTQTAEKPKGEKESEPESILKFENEADIDPEILSNLKKMEQTYKETIEKLSEKVNALQSGLQKQRADEFVKRFDRMVDSLGLEFVDTFGKGSTNDLSMRSQAFRNRDAVRTRMYAFAKGLTDSGQPVPEEQQLFDLAVNSLYGDKVQKVKGLRTSTKTKQYVKGARVQRPATRKAGNLTPFQKAVETSKKFDEQIDTSED